MNDYHKLIADAVTAHAAKIGRLIDYIEVGVLTGNSAEAVLATGTVRYAVLIDNFTLAFDPPQSKETVEARLAPYKGLFDVRVGNSQDILPTIIEQFDVGFVDGDHSAESTLFDMTNMLPLLRDDGIMFIHDLMNPTYNFLPQLVGSFANDNDLKMQFHQGVMNGLGELTR